MAKSLLTNISPDNAEVSGVTVRPGKAVVVGQSTTDAIAALGGATKILGIWAVSEAAEGSPTDFAAVTVDAVAGDQTGSAGTGATGSSGTGGVTGVSASDGVVATTSATPAIAAITDSRHDTAMAPIAADLVTIVAAIDMANGAQVIAAQPDVPRKLQVRIVDANASVSAGAVALVGVGVRGQPLSQSIPLTGGTQTVTTADAYAKLTSATIAGLVGEAPGDTIGIGPSNALGLNAPQTPIPGTFAVHKATVAATGALTPVDEAVGTVDAAAGTISPTTAPDGARRFDFHYTFQFTPTQASHTHTGGAHTHAAGSLLGPAHTHTGPAHTHTQV